MIAGAAAPLRAMVWAMPTLPPCEVTPSAPIAFAADFTRRRSCDSETPKSDPFAFAGRIAFSALTARADTATILAPVLPPRTVTVPAPPSASHSTSGHSRAAASDTRNPAS